MTDEVRMTVRIECDAASHAPNVARLTEFIITGVPNGPWRLGGKGWGGRKQLVGDEVVSVLDLAGRDNPLKEESRNRYSLQCRMCGLHVQAREETIAKMIVDAARSGVSRIPLQTLAAIL